MRAVVFVGPSLDPTTAASILPAEMRPPIGRGDIDKLFSREPYPRYIGIIDGQFLQCMSISPKEILRVMVNYRAKVFGSSSIGALRAVELAPYGMVGVGQVYEMYRSGAVDEDDEVAITYDPDSLKPMCVPMVNIRVAINAAVERDVVSAQTAALAITVAKNLYFPDRTYEMVLHLLTGQAPEAELQRLRAFLSNDASSGAPDAKREDAVALLTAIRDAMAEHDGRARNTPRPAPRPATARPALVGRARITDYRV